MILVWPLGMGQIPTIFCGEILMSKSPIDIFALKLSKYRR